MIKDIDIELRDKRVAYWEKHRKICKISDLELSNPKHEVRKR